MDCVLFHQVLAEAMEMVEMVEMDVLERECPTDSHAQTEVVLQGKERKCNTEFKP